MKVLMLNGSPRKNGNIALAFGEMEQVFEKNGVEYENILLGRMDIRGCIACETCRKNHKCAFDDIVNELAGKFEKADGLVIGSPVYYGSANGTLMSALQRLFYSTSFDKSLKVGASVVSARRSGCTATFDELNKFLLFRICRLQRVSIGITFTVGNRAKEKLMMKEDRLCVYLHETWFSL